MDKLYDLFGVEFVGIGNIIYVEVLQGFRLDDDFLKVKDVLDKLVIFNMLIKLIVFQFVVNFRRFRK